MAKTTWQQLVPTKLRETFRLLSLHTAWGTPGKATQHLIDIQSNTEHPCVTVFWGAEADRLGTLLGIYIAIPVASRPPLSSNAIAQLFALQRAIEQAIQLPPPPGPVPADPGASEDPLFLAAAASACRAALSNDQHDFDYFERHDPSANPWLGTTIVGAPPPKVGTPETGAVAKLKTLYGKIRNALNT